MSKDRKRFLARRPRLASFARIMFDGVRERWIVQAPERVLVLDDTSKEILDLCDGKATTAAIVESLLSDYDAPAEIIEHDVLAILDLLDERNLLEWGQDGDEQRLSTSR